MSRPQTPAQAPRLAGVKGMNDVLPPNSAAVEALEARVRCLMARYAYRNIRTPIVEHTQLFSRGLGEVTDIVEKEMYTFEDRLNGDSLTLRPECTAGVVRAVVEHAMLYDGGKRLYYVGPMFRHERPQRGATGSLTRLALRRWASVGPRLMQSSSCWQWRCGMTLACVTCGLKSTAWASRPSGCSTVWP